MPFASAMERMRLTRDTLRPQLPGDRAHRESRVAIGGDDGFVVVGVIAVDRRAAVTARGDVVDGAREFEAERLGHGAESCGWRGKRQDLTQYCSVKARIRSLAPFVWPS